MCWCRAVGRKTQNPKVIRTDWRWSNGFRADRSARQALERARERLRTRYRWVVGMALGEVFQWVNHAIL